MDTYNTAAQEAAELLTKRYSTSFSMACRLLPAAARPHIYNIYGLVRVADEIVDTYQGADSLERLASLEHETTLATATGYSANIIVHAFALTVRYYNIDAALVAAFFDSMRMDCQPVAYDDVAYRRYIHGSAEVVGLMCLRVFVDAATYDQLATGAAHLGAAFQKVNFLRDLADDHQTRQRYYFPTGSFDTFDDATRDQIVADIRADFTTAVPAIHQLPAHIRPGVLTAADYFTLLLDKLAETPAKQIKQERVRIPNRSKLWMLAKRQAAQQLHRGA